MKNFLVDQFDGIEVLRYVAERYKHNYAQKWKGFGCSSPRHWCRPAFARTPIRFSNLRD